MTFFPNLQVILTRRVRSGLIPLGTSSETPWQSWWKTYSLKIQTISAVSSPMMRRSQTSMYMVHQSVVLAYHEYTILKRHFYVCEMYLRESSVGHINLYHIIFFIAPYVTVIFVMLLWWFHSSALMLPWWGTKWPTLDCLKTFEWGGQDLPIDRSTSRLWTGTCIYVEISEMISIRHSCGAS